MKHFILLLSLLLTYPIATLQASTHSDSDHGYSADDDEADSAPYPINPDAASLLKTVFQARKAKSHSREILRSIKDPTEQLQFVKSTASFSPSIHSNNDLKTLFNIFADQHELGTLLNFSAHAKEIRGALFYTDTRHGRPLKGENMLEILISLNTITIKDFLCPATEMASTIAGMEPFIRAPGMLQTDLNNCFLAPLAAKTTWTNTLTDHLFAYIERYKRAFEYQNKGRTINIMTIGSLFGAIKLFLEQSNTEIFADTDPIGLPAIEKVDAALAEREATDDL